MSDKSARQDLLRRLLASRPENIGLVSVAIAPDAAFEGLSFPYIVSKDFVLLKESSAAQMVDQSHESQVVWWESMSLSVAKQRLDRTTDNLMTVMHTTFSSLLGVFASMAPSVVVIYPVIFAENAALYQIQKREKTIARADQIRGCLQSCVQSSDQIAAENPTALVEHLYQTDRDTFRLGNMLQRLVNPDVATAAKEEMARSIIARE